MSDTVQVLQRLFIHLAWADERALAAVRAAPTADPRLRELYAHILGAEHNWLCRMSGVPPRVSVWPGLTIEECETLARDNHTELHGIVNELSRTQLDRAVTYRNSAGLEFTSTVEDILLHVALHGTYHRGQIAMGLRAGGFTPQATDYIAWRRGAPAATRK